MAATVVDTSVLLARVDSDDPRHDVATAIVAGIDAGELPTGQVPDTAVLETLNWVHTRHRHDTATEFLRRLHDSSGFELAYTVKRDVNRAEELFETYDSFAFGDAAIAAYMERTDIGYLYSFDDDFDVLDWVTRLDTPDDPYG